MAAKRLTPEEASFIKSLRALVARGGSLDTMLVDRVPPIAPPSAGAKPAVQVVEPLKGYWTGNTSFSRAFNGDYPSVAGSQTMIEAAQLPGPPRGRGITLNREDRRVTPGVALNLNYAIWADIEFGIGGAIQRVRLDWKNCIINVPGSRITVNTVWGVVDETNPYNVGNPIEVAGSLGASISVDPLVAKGLNTFTEYFDATTLPDVLVPPYAVGFYLPLLPSAVYAAADVVSVADVTDPTQVTAPFIGDIQTSVLQANGLLNYTPLPTSAALLRFTASGISPGDSFKIIWVMAV